MDHGEDVDRRQVQPGAWVDCGNGRKCSPYLGIGEEDLEDAVDITATDSTYDSTFDDLAGVLVTERLECSKQSFS